MMVLWDIEQISFTLFATCVTVLAIFGFLRIFNKRKRKPINTANLSKKGHFWTPIVIKELGFYCACCKNSLKTGYECDFCTLKVDKIRCIQEISDTLQCKARADLNIEDDQTKMLRKHHWVPGNIDEDKFCIVCEELCGGGVRLCDYRCSWCKEAVHTNCLKKAPEICDFGPFRPFVIPPCRLYSRKSALRNQRSLIITGMEPLDGLKPIFVLINPKSGSGAGVKTIREFRKYLHPLQVIDITKSNLQQTLAWMDEHDNAQIDMRILIAGGDGSICSVLDIMDNLNVRRPVALFPLGTGNDLSRTMKWGSATDERFDVLNLLKTINEGPVKNVDRWNIDLLNKRKKLGYEHFSSTRNMTNYISIGVDARVTLGMQSTRYSIPKFLRSRLMNKLLFFTYGTRDVLWHTCRNLQNDLELFLNDSRDPVPLPVIESLVFLNIPYWGAGVEPWANAPEKWPQALDDGLFEIFAVTSSFHIAQMQVGMSSPIYIGQAYKATIKIRNKDLPMQCDGEAWFQRPALITITHKGQTPLIEHA